MKVISTNIGKPREVMWQGERVMTGIYKEPVEVIHIRKFFVEGDNVSDLQVHGGERKAVYGYPSEHYEFWRNEFPGLNMPWGMFGENITTEGLTEREVMTGSVYRIGTALLQATQPRMPCYKLSIRFGRRDIVKRFLKSRRSGFYFTVVAEGMVRPADHITLEHSGDSGDSILDIVEKHSRKEP